MLLMSSGGPRLPLIGVRCAANLSKAIWRRLCQPSRRPNPGGNGASGASEAQHDSTGSCCSLWRGWGCTAVEPPYAYLRDGMELLVKELHTARGFRLAWCIVAVSNVGAP